MVEDSGLVWLVGHIVYFDVIGAHYFGTSSACTALATLVLQEHLLSWHICKQLNAYKDKGTDYDVCPQLPPIQRRKQKKN